MLIAVVLLVLGVCHVDGRIYVKNGYTCTIEDETNILQNCTGTGGYLGLSGQGITGIQSGSSTFTTGTNLNNLDMGDNAITEIQSGAFSILTKLSTLFLNNNAIAWIENGAFSGLTNFYSLYLDNNAITGIPTGEFTGLTELANLWLSGNPLVCSNAGGVSPNWVQGTAISSICTSCTAQNGGTPQTVTVDSIDFWQCSNTTESPTVSPPTESPTVSPSVSPTVSQSPTESPTVSPTVSPTESPTVSPTVSQSPTESPTESPTATFSPTSSQAAPFSTYLIGIIAAMVGVIIVLE